MAILIPSKNIYDKQNPKVMDNVIERIEVGAVEIKPNTEYAVVVHTTNDYEEQYEQNVSDFKLIAQYVGAIGNNYQQFAGATGVKAIFRDIYIKIPIVNNNKAISYVFYGKSKDDENQIKSTIQYKKYTGTKQFKISYSANPTSSFGESSNSVTWETYKPYYSNNETGSVDLWSQEDEDGYYKPIKYELSIGKDKTKIVSSSIQDITNINSAKIKKTPDGDFYEVALTIWVGGEYYSGSLPNEQVSQGSLAGNSYNFYATAEKIEPLKVEISIYGQTIGIDLTDKTVYINGETAKKVHSIYGNELMQTSNYYQSTDTNAIERAFTHTQTDYAKGKETATIRCSISDYFHYNSEEENKKGDLAISIDKKQFFFENDFAKVYVIQPSRLYEIYAEIQNPLPFDLSIKIKYKTNFELENTLIIEKGKTSSNFITVGYTVRPTVNIISIFYTCPMAFNAGDQVIPMVYGADRKDRPMSNYQDGTPKVFQVLGTNIYYDGAVWQELSLQEVDKNKVL